MIDEDLDIDYDYEQWRIQQSLDVAANATHWIAMIGMGKKLRGKTLVHTRSGTHLGHAEPYRGGGPKEMVDGEMHFKKGWWVTVLDCAMPFKCEGFYAKEYCTHRKTLEDAENIIRELKGLSNATN